MPTFARHSFGTEQILSQWRYQQEKKGIEEDKIREDLMKAAGEGILPQVISNPKYAKFLGENDAFKQALAATYMGAQKKQANAQWDVDAKKFNLELDIYSKYGDKMPTEVARKKAENIDASAKKLGIETNFTSAVDFTEHKKEVGEKALYNAQALMGQLKKDSPYNGEFGKRIKANLDFARNMGVNEKRIADASKDFEDVRTAILSQQEKDSTRKQQLADEERKLLAGEDVRFTDAKMPGKVFTAKQGVFDATSAREPGRYSKIGIGKESTADKGLKITADGKGGFEILTNADQGTTAQTENTIQKKVLDAQENLRRMRGIVDEFNPEYLKKPFRLTQSFNDKAEAWGLKDLSGKEKLSLEEYSAFGRKSIEHLNLYIKEITGAQMSEAEADRLKLAVPDFGATWWRGDGPTKFKAKMLDAYKQSVLANARYNYMTKNGLTIAKNDKGEAVAFLDGNGELLTLEKFQDVIDKRGEELRRQGIEDKEVLKQLSKEFGMAF